MAATTEKKRHGNTKVSREDWLRAARDILVREGVGEVKVLSLSHVLGVSRSSFYWYFEDRSDLLGALLTEWEARNTRCIIDKTGQPSETISHAVCNFFECFVDDRLFDQRMDFAVREWARRDPAIRSKIDAADAARLSAVTAAFQRHGFDHAEADARARILYFMQLGYHALEVDEPMRDRMARLAHYLKGFTGETADPELVSAFSERSWAK